MEGNVKLKTIEGRRRLHHLAAKVSPVRVEREKRRATRGFSTISRLSVNCTDWVAERNGFELSVPREPSMVQDSARLSRGIRREEKPSMLQRIVRREFRRFDCRRAASGAALTDC
jgi:hypothetical protein